MADYIPSRPIPSIDSYTNKEENLYTPSRPIPSIDPYTNKEENVYVPSRPIPTLDSFKIDSPIQKSVDPTTTLDSYTPPNMQKEMTIDTNLNQEQDVVLGRNLEGLDVTEDFLKQDRQFITDAKTIYKSQKGVNFKGTDADAAKWLLNRKSRMDWNLTNAGLTAWEAQDWDLPTKQAWLRTMETTAESNITGRSAGKALFWSLFDVPTLLTAGFAPVARAIGAKPLSETVKYGFKTALRKKIQEELIAKGLAKPIAIAAAKRGGIKELGEAAVKQIRKDVAGKVAFNNALAVWAPTGAAYAGIFDILHQDIESDVDPRRSDFDYRRFAFSTLLGAGAGGALGLLMPRVGERLTRNKFVRDALENDPEKELERAAASPELWGIKDQEANIVEQGRIAKGTDEAIEIAEQEILKLKEQGLPVKVHSTGSGELNPKTKVIDEKVRLENAGADDVTTNEFPINRDRAINIIGEDPYTNPDNLGRGDSNIVVSSNLGGAYENPMLFGSVLDKDIKNMAPDGIMILNRGPQKLKNIADIEGDIDLGRLETQSGKILREGKDDIPFEQRIKETDETKKAFGPVSKQTEIMQKTGLSEEEFADLIYTRFAKVELRKTKKGNVYIASEPRTFTPNTGTLPETQTVFQKLMSFRNNWLKSDLNLKGLENATAAQKGAIKAAGRQIEQTWGRVSYAMKSWKNKEGVQWKFWDRAAQDKSLEEMNILYKNARTGSSPEAKAYRLIAADETIPDAIKKNMDNLRKSTQQFQFTLLPKDIRKTIKVAGGKEIPNPLYNPKGLGLIEADSDIHTQIVKSMGKGKDGTNIELYYNKQYEIFDNPKWIQQLQKRSPEKITLAREWFIKALQEDNTYLKLESDSSPTLKTITRNYREARDQLLDKKEITFTAYNKALNRNVTRKLYYSKIDEYRRSGDNFPELDAVIVQKQKEINTIIKNTEGVEAQGMLNLFLRQYGPDELENIKTLMSADDFFRGKARTTAGEAKKTKGIFFARKGLPPVLQDVMGLYKDPFTNYANTIMKLYQTKANFKFETAIKDLVKAGKFPSIKGKPNTIRDEMLQANLNDPALVGLKPLTDASRLPQGEGFTQPLKGLLADDVIFDAIKSGNELAPLMNPHWKMALMAQATTRLAKTAYSVAAFPRNFAGAMLKAFAAGNLNIANIKVATKVFKGMRAFTDDELGAELEKQLYLGVMDSGARAGTLKASLEEASNPNWFTDVGVMLGRANLSELGFKKYITGKFSRLNKNVLNAYQGMDDIWKLYSFTNEKQNYKKILNDRYAPVRDGVYPIGHPKEGQAKFVAYSDQVIDSWETGGIYKKGHPKAGQPIKVEITNLDQYAAKMVRAHMDNYGEVNRMVKLTRRLPVADFIAYKTEQYRTTRNIIQTALRDIREGNAIQKARKLNEDGSLKGRAQMLLGYKRMGSVISAVSLPAALVGTASYYHGTNKKATVKIGSQEYELPYSINQAMREAAMPDYASGQMYMPIGKRKADGTFPYLNLSYVDPWAPWTEPLLSALRSASGDRTLEQSFEKASKEVASNLYGSIGPSMLLEGVMGAVFNLDKYGNTIQNKNEDLPTQFKDRIIRLVEPFKPGILRDAIRIHDTAKYGVTEKGGFKLKPSSTALKSFGVPMETVDPKLSLPFKAAPFLKKIQQSGSFFKDSIKTYHPKTAGELIETYKKSLELEYNATNDLARLLIAARGTGMSTVDIYKSLTKDGRFPNKFTKSVAQSIMTSGKFIPSTQTISKDLIMWANLIKQQTKGDGPPLLAIQKELMQIYKSYAGASLPFLNDLQPIDKE